MWPRGWTVGGGRRSAPSPGSDDGFLLAAASGQAPVTGAEEGVGARIGEGDAAQRAGQAGVAPTAALALVLLDLPADW